MQDTMLETLESVFFFVPKCFVFVAVVFLNNMNSCQHVQGVSGLRPVEWFLSESPDKPG